MNQETQLATAPANTFSLAPSSMNEAIEFASQVAKCDLLPDHLKDKPGNCLRVVMQSAQWGMNFFGVADKTSVIQGKLMYEGQLTAAVINACGNLKHRLNYKFAETKDRTLTVIGTLRGEDEPRTVTLTYDQACKINRNGQMQKNPEQQMCYIGARIWARRHMPELMLGVYGSDEHIEDGEISDTEDKPARPKPPAKNKGANAAKREMKAAEKVEEEAKAEAKDIEIVDDEPEANKEEPKPAESEPAEPEPETKPEPEAKKEESKPKEKAKEPEPKKEAKEEPATALEVGQVIQATFAVEKVNPKKDKSGNPLLELTIRGDDYAGIAYSKDTENELLNSEGVAELKIKGVNTPSGKVLVLVDSASEAVNF